ncbi:hypothetical protein GUJ93_ZPchr0087g7035 [Zizania palustris]|uniref:Uncharacterized protein n=1 Tax=Zizania palustris TaxID=103762 RepID=A0A8J5QUF0_ZIZPA|nr:hypothetical protein GUJ93_ZPchr0087g7035 [Zizania palustris]
MPPHLLVTASTPLLPPLAARHPTATFVSTTAPYPPPPCRSHRTLRLPVARTVDSATPPPPQPLPLARCYDNPSRDTKTLQPSHPRSRSESKNDEGSLAILQLDDLLLTSEDVSVHTTTQNCNIVNWNLPIHKLHGSEELPAKLPDEDVVLIISHAHPYHCDKIEDVVSMDYIRSLKFLPMAQFESQI